MQKCLLGKFFRYPNLYIIICKVIFAASTGIDKTLNNINNVCNILFKEDYLMKWRRLYQQRFQG